VTIEQMHMQAHAKGWRIEQGEDLSFRLVTAQGTLVAVADWSKPDSYGLSVVDLWRLLEE
jgi:hypothetical protein